MRQRGRLSRLRVIDRPSRQLASFLSLLCVTQLRKRNSSRNVHARRGFWVFGNFVRLLQIGNRGIDRCVVGHRALSRRTVLFGSRLHGGKQALLEGRLPLRWPTLRG